MIEAGPPDPASLGGRYLGGNLHERLKLGHDPAITACHQANYRIGAYLLSVLVPSLKGVVRGGQGFQNNFGALLIGACAPNRAAIPGLGTGLYPDAGNEMSRELEMPVAPESKHFTVVLFITLRPPVKEIALVGNGYNHGFPPLESRAGGGLYAASHVSGHVYLNGIGLNEFSNQGPIPIQGEAVFSGVDIAQGDGDEGKAEININTGGQPLASFTPSHESVTRIGHRDNIHLGPFQGFFMAGEGLSSLGGENI